MFDSATHVFDKAWTNLIYHNSAIVYYQNYQPQSIDHNCPVCVLCCVCVRVCNILISIQIVFFSLGNQLFT